MKKISIAIVAALLLLVVAAGSVFADQEMTARQLLLTGTYHATENDTVVLPNIYVDGHGSGNASDLGLYTVHYIFHVIQSGVVGYGTGWSKFTAADGSTLTASVTGVGVPSSTPGVNHIVENLTITGGTGRFVHASGKLTVDRLLNFQTRYTSGTISGTIILP